MTNAEILALVQRALDEFDDRPLDQSVRRALRIATLLGETKMAVRLSLELRPVGGHPPANAEDTRRLMSDPDEWSSPTGPNQSAMTEYLADRAHDDQDLVVAHALAEIAFWLQENAFLATPERLETLSDSTYRASVASRLKFVQIIELTRARVFAALCGWERQLSFAVTHDEIFSGHQKRVHGVLAASAPDVIDRFNAVIRRLRDAAEAGQDAAATEELAQAVITCRRILKLVVDAVQPPDPAQPTSDDGHVLTDDAYKNRLFEYLKRNESQTFEAAITAAAQALFERFSATDSLASKGVHAQVALDEAEFCALNTYLLAGEIMRPRPDDSQR